MVGRMRNRWRLSGSVGLVLTLLSVASACSSTRSGADAANGTGGSGGADEDAGSEAATGGGGSTGARFNCGDASCVAGQTYCRVLSSRGGNTGNGSSNTMYRYDCPPFIDGCPAPDCTCAALNANSVIGTKCEDCSQLDGGGVVASCSHF
jgi:hypothetical protein